LSFYNQEELGGLVGDQVAIIEGTSATDFTEIITTQSKGTALWKWCLILALIFLAIETALLRFWKIK